METGTPSRPHSSQIGSRRGSSTVTSLPDLSRTPRPRSFKTFRPRAPRPTASSSWAIISWLKSGSLILLQSIWVKNHETLGVWFHHLVDDSLQLVAPHSGQNHDCLHVRVVHDLDYALRRHVFLDTHRIIDVVVDINDVILGAVYFVR